MAIYISTQLEKEAYATGLIINFGRAADRVVLEMTKVVPKDSALYHDLIKVMMIVDEKNSAIRKSIYGDKA